MTATSYLVWFIFMAVATMTILVVGTLCGCRSCCTSSANEGPCKGALGDNHLESSSRKTQEFAGAHGQNPPLGETPTSSTRSCHWDPASPSALHLGSPKGRPNPLLRRAPAGPTRTHRTVGVA